MTVCRPDRVVLLFVDGFGWGDPDPGTNPQHAYAGELLRLPQQPPAATAVRLPRDGWAVPVDAVLGVDGKPQSATGQTSLLTGRNAQARLGRHLAGFPNETLRGMLLADSVLKQLRDRGISAAFINVFRPLFFDLAREAQLRLSATTVANLAADLPFFTLDDLCARRAIYQDVTNASLRERGFDVPDFSPTDAGRILGRRAGDFDFILFEYFQSDRIGHTGDMERGCRQLDVLDEFLGTVLDVAPAGTLVLLCSDHGNLEDTRTRRHTINPVPLAAWGPGAVDFVAGRKALTDVTPAIVKLLSGR